MPPIAASELTSIREMRRVYSLIILAGLMLSAPVRGQDRISVESTIDKQSITIGDHVRYTVKISADTSLLVDSLAVGTNLGMFEIKDYTPRKSEVSGGMRVSTESYEITTFTTGDYQIPPITIRYQDRAGESKTIATDPIAIKVNSLLKGEEGEDIKPLRGPKDYEGRIPLWVLITAAAVALGVLLFLYFYRRAGKPIDLGREAVDNRLPWEIALAELQALRNSDLIAKGLYKPYYLRLSEVFRKYLERRYGISALERTTHEIIGEFRGLALDKVEEEAIRKLLEECDLVKFAKYDPTQADIERHYQMAYDFVVQTRSLPFTSAPQAEAAG